MQPDERIAAHLWDMRQNADEVRQIVEGQPYERFVSNKLARWAIERLLEIIGEAANRVPESFQLQHPDIPWRRIIGQRNVLAHEYDAIDYRRIYEVATALMTPLIEKIDEIMGPPRQPVAPDA